MRARIGHVLGVVLVLGIAYVALEVTARLAVLLTGGVS